MSAVTRRWCPRLAGAVILAWLGGCAPLLDLTRPLTAASTGSIEAPAEDAAPTTLAARRGDKPVIPGFLSRSGSRAGGPANDLNTGDARARERLPEGSVAEAASGKLYHGNYCGVGNRGPDHPPTDALDAACARHDQCYDTYAHGSCDCNRALEREALAIAASSTYSRELRRRAASVAETATALVCSGP